MFRISRLRSRIARAQRWLIDNNPRMRKVATAIRNAVHEPTSCGAVGAVHVPPDMSLFPTGPTGFTLRTDGGIFGETEAEAEAEAIFDAIYDDPWNTIDTDPSHWMWVAAAIIVILDRFAGLVPKQVLWVRAARHIPMQQDQDQ